MRRFLLHILALLAFVGLIAAPVPCQGAEDETPQKANFGFTSILPQIKEFPEQDKVEFIGISDRKLQDELKALRKTYGYNSFESLKSDSMAAVKGKAIEYKMVNSMNYFCRLTVTKIQTWIDDENREHTFVSFKAVVVERKRTNDGKTVDDEVIKIDKTIEAGKYLILVFRDFFPATADKEAQDLVLALQPLT